MKRGTTFILLFTAILTLAAGSAFGAYSGGTGDPCTPYQIATNADLLVLAADTNDYNKCLILTADINMGGQVFTTAIIAAYTNSNGGFQGMAFTGTFDGNNHKITNFTINGGNNFYLGLFGEINGGGSVKNLGLENCSVSGIYLVGGLVGTNEYCSISNCYSTGTVSGVSGSEFVGGLVGYNYAGSISKCYSTGTVSGSYYVGGLVGENDTGSINNCYSTGTVSGSYGVGGLAGWTYLESINNCYSTGLVSGASGSEYVGGLVGTNEYCSISNCYSTGTVSNGSGSEYVGGLVGENYSSGSIVSSFWDINTSGQTTSAGGTGMTTAQMKTESTFTNADWDFTTIWRMRCEGMNYPKLNWQVIPTADWVCPDGVDFADFAYFAKWWQTTGCDSSNNFCGGTDMDSSGTVDMADLAIFAANWLSGE